MSEALDLSDHYTLMAQGYDLRTLQPTNYKKLLESKVELTKLDSVTEIKSDDIEMRESEHQAPPLALEPPHACD